MSLYLSAVEAPFKRAVVDDITAFNAFNLFFIVCAKNNRLSTLLI